LLEGAAGTRLL